MKPWLLALCFVFAFPGQTAQPPAWQPSPGHTQVPIWLGTVPDEQPAAGPEITAKAKTLVAGRTWDYVEKRVATYDDGLLANGKQHGRCSGRVSGRRLSDSGHRS